MYHKTNKPCFWSQLITFLMYATVIILISAAVGFGINVWFGIASLIGLSFFLRNAHVEQVEARERFERDCY